MEMTKYIIVDGGEVFEGTLKQFNDAVFAVETIDDIVEWCGDHGYGLEVKDQFVFPVIGYGNKTAFHPTGSYIGFERATVFSSELTYVSCAHRAVEQLQEQIEDLQAKVEELQGQLDTQKVVRQQLERALSEKTGI